MITNFNESVPYLYHSCSLNSCIYNLENNSLQGRVYERSDGTKYSTDKSDGSSSIPVVCFTRSPRYIMIKGEVHKGSSTGFARFKVNRDKLNTRYKIVTANFHPELHGIELKKVDYKNRYKKFETTYNESEERVIGRTINNLSKYVEILDIYLYKDKKSKVTDELKQIDELTHKHGITCRITFLTEKDLGHKHRFLITPDSKRKWIELGEYMEKHTNFSRLINRLDTLNFNIFNKEDRDEYTKSKEHAKIVQAIYYSLFGKSGLHFHDFLKRVNILIFSDKLATKWHRKYNKHHGDENKRIKNIVEACIDWQSARFTKPEKPLDAFDTFKKFYWYKDKGPDAEFNSYMYAKTLQGLQKIAEEKNAINNWGTWWDYKDKELNSWIKKFDEEHK